MTISEIYQAHHTPKSKPISWATFEKKYLSREDSWKYELVNGIIEKTKHAMYPHQFFILANLRDLFKQLEFNDQISGYLESETDIFILKNIHRRPGLTYFTKNEVALMAQGKFPTPKFVIEIISKGDNLVKQNLKMKNY